MDNKTKIQEIENRLTELQEEKERLLKELNDILATKDEVTHHEIMGKSVLDSPPTTSEEKTDLFIKLFRCREDVYPKFWENKNKNTQGFSPVCKNEWIRGKCDKFITDPERLSLIAQDVIKVLMDNRFPLILSERKEHLNLLSEEIKKQAAELSIAEFIMSGDMGKKARKKALEDIQSALINSQRPYILSTGSLIGEGFDLPELDTLIIAMPFSFKGRVVQYAGRLHRQLTGKTDALIYDYLDINSGLMISMFKKRLTAYKEMEYEIDVADNIKILRFMKQYKKTKKNDSAELFST